MAYGARTIVTLAIPVALLAGFGAVFVPCSREAASYVCVSSPDKYTDTLFGPRLPGRPNGDFLVHDNKLYLKVQGLHHAMVLVTGVRRYDWTTDKLAKFRAEHPELDQYFTDTAKSNAGIAWITK